MSAATSTPTTNSASVYAPPASFGITPSATTPVLPSPPTPKQSTCTTPNNTIYINNLNEKVKIPGGFLIDLFYFSFKIWLDCF